VCGASSLLARVQTCNFLATTTTSATRNSTSTTAKRAPEMHGEWLGNLQNIVVADILPLFGRVLIDGSVSPAPMPKRQKLHDSGPGGGADPPAVTLQNTKH
jgi:hypothetical protein